MAATKNGLGEAIVEGYLAGLKGGSGPESWAWSVLDELLAHECPVNDRAVHRAVARSGRPFRGPLQPPSLGPGSRPGA